MSDREAAGTQRHKRRFGRLNNVWLDLSVELARKSMNLGELRQIEENDVIDFDKLAGEAFDVLLNGRKFAEGEIVVVTDLMAIRLTGFVNCEAVS